MQKDNLFKRMIHAMEHKGFYMILGLCAAAVGVSCYVLFFTTPQPTVRTGEMIAGEIRLPDESGKPENRPVPKPERAKKPSPNPSNKVPEPSKQTTKPASAQKPVEIAQPPAEKTAETSKKADKQKDVKMKIFTLPIQSAEVQRSFSGEELVYDPTMKDWRTHNGVDFACKAGDTVMAVLDGVIADIYDDGLFGTCIRIDHGAGIESICCGVSVQEGLQKDQTVKAGQTIGTAAVGNLAESAQPFHLHLEMRENGKAIDPFTILK